MLTDAKINFFIHSIFQKLAPEVWNVHKKLLYTPKSTECFRQALTSPSVNQTDNYEVFEQLGDLSVNKAIVTYMYNRFPNLKTPEGVKIVARLRVNYSSKVSLSKLAFQYGFWEVLDATPEKKESNKVQLLEDVFEAFFGALETILDEHYHIGMGYHVSYILICKIFDQKKISLEHDDLFDAKTRLTEYIAKETKRVGKVIWKYKEVAADPLNKVQVKHIAIVYGRDNVILGRGEATSRVGAEKIAATYALKTLQV